MSFEYSISHYRNNAFTLTKYLCILNIKIGMYIFKTEGTKDV